MTAPDNRVAVLGLGRMGSAMADRLRERDWEVAGWTRSAGGDPAGAVEKAGIVLLCLFDGAACEEVLAAADLPPDAVVVNTSTIGPDEAAALADRLGTAYVHAPVLGSVPAATTGGLTIVAAGTALDRVRPLLDDLGDVVAVADARTAAALKLVANSSLAGAVLGLRGSLQQADALGLGRDEALDVLARGQLGRLVAAKRDLLLGADGVAHFTVGALAKDLALLAEATGLPLRAADELAGSPAGADADIALAATVPPVADAVLAPLRDYVRGHATGRPAYFLRAFLPTAHVEGLREGEFVSWSLEEYVQLFDGTPAPDEESRRRRIDSVDVHGTVATASMTLWHGDTTFTDVFLLALVDGAWRIANKAYHRSGG
ncbi:MULTISPECIES: nuclear transport factor 2 family protein [unclassified Nocardioides]|uniref:nuclear transport factor 2 family protein n=1 Tax=unclassified Nocardioides TaxID=2615069 RepID=UPI003621728D